MTNTDRNIEIELTILEAMAKELEDYIVDDNVYRTVLVSTGTGNRQVQMSGGELLSHIQSLQAIRPNLTGEEKDRLNGIITQVETTKQELKTRLHELLRRELKSRLGTLDWSEERRIQDEEKSPTPAEQQNYRRIAAIRRELADDIPRETTDDLDRLEAQLQAAVEELQHGQHEIDSL